MLKIALFTYFLATFTYLACAELEIFNDEELLNLMKNEKYIIVLFTRRDCEECDNYENELISLREDLVDAIGTWVVKVPNSQLTRLYSPTKEPALVFFRLGIPLLYHGPLDSELIFNTFAQNKEPIVKELTDQTFEHLTQAATGATTGDWFVMFYTNDCVDCQRFQAQFEAVGAKIKGRVNVARVHRGTTGAATARRFDVFFVPAFIFFRHGKMYRYHIQKYDIDSFVSFTQDWYKNVKAEKVPAPKTPFDDLVVSTVNYLRENTWLIYVGLGTFVLGLAYTLIALSKRRLVEKVKEKPTKKKEK